MLVTIHNSTTDTKYYIDRNKMTCSCSFNLQSGLPCSHVLFESTGQNGKPSVNLEYVSGQWRGESVDTAFDCPAIFSPCAEPPFNFHVDCPDSDASCDSDGDDDGNDDRILPMNKKFAIASDLTKDLVQGLVKQGTRRFRDDVSAIERLLRAMDQNIPISSLLLPADSIVASRPLSANRDSPMTILPVTGDAGHTDEQETASTAAARSDGDVVAANDAQKGDAYEQDNNDDATRSAAAAAASTASTDQAARHVLPIYKRVKPRGRPAGKSACAYRAKASAKSKLAVPTVGHRAEDKVLTVSTYVHDRQPF